MEEKKKVPICMILFAVIIVCVGADAVLFFGRAKGKDTYMVRTKQEAVVDTVNKVENVVIQNADFTVKAGDAVNYADDSGLNDGSGSSGADSDGYIFPNSDSAYLEKAEVQKLSKKELRLARNELYARHGYIFGDEELKEYFEGKDWYVPSISGDEFEDAEYFNEYELANRDLIKKMESQ